MALRVVPKLLYGDGHAYAQPLTGTGTEATLAALTREDLVRFHAQWFRPNHATLIAVGPVTVASLKPQLERLLADWQPGDIPAKQVADVTPRASRTLYLLDKPGADQSVIFAGQLIPPRATPDDVAIELMNDVLGGQFTSRLNMNLREDKHWSYGARSFAYDARGQRPLLAYAPVQTDKTAESLAEIRKEFAEIVGKRPATPEEVAMVKRTNTLSLPGQWETGGAVLGSISQIVQFGLPDDYWNDYAATIRGVDAGAGQQGRAGPPAARRPGAGGGGRPPGHRARPEGPRLRVDPAGKRRRRAPVVRWRGPRARTPATGIAAVCVLVYFFTNGMSLFVPQNLFPRFMETFGATPAEVSRTTAITFGISGLLAPVRRRRHRPLRRGAGHPHRPARPRHHLHRLPGGALAAGPLSPARA